MNEDFNQVKTEDTDSMSIFKLSEEELYDDVKPTREKKTRSPKKKTTRNMIIMMVVAGVAVITAIIALVWGINQQKLYKEAQANFELAQAKNKTYETRVAELEKSVTDLENKIKEIESAGAKADSKYTAGVTLRITEEGGQQGIRTKASTDSEIAMVDGHQYVLYWGETVKLLEDAVVDSNGTYWGKIEGGFVRIEVDGVAWATVVE